MLNTMSEITKTPCKTLPAGIGRVLKRLHYPLDVILLCVRWYAGVLAEPAQPRRDDGPSAESRSIIRACTAGSSNSCRCWKRRFGGTSDRWARPAGGMDETYVKVKGQWKFLYRAVDKEGNTVDFMLRAHRDKAAARRYFEKAIDQNGEPETITVDKSGANLAALQALNAEREIPIKIRQNKYLNNLVEQDHG